MLDKIVDAKKLEVLLAKKNCPVQNLASQVETGSFALSKVLNAAAWSLIAECKLASPIKGRLCSRFTVAELAAIYSLNGAAALSILTDRHFHGCLQHLAEVRKVTALPLLRKDFIIDEYQLFEARAAGADAVLLIARILSQSQLREFLAIAGELGLDCLVEVHSREELDKVLETEARIIGINNRDLQSFTTDIAQTFTLLPYIDNRLVISESGIGSASDVSRLKEAGVRGALVGEGLVTAAAIAEKVQELAFIDMRRNEHA